MNQEERLDYLIEQFKEDSGEYRNLKTPSDPAEKRRILRSLMNIRMPRKMDPEVLMVQDEYLQQRNRENGIVNVSGILSCAERGSRKAGADHIAFWQGDITRLDADAIVNAANSRMLGCFIPMHACIDNCIHTYAGIQMRAECARQMNQLRIRYGAGYEQPTAVPMITDAYNLPSGKVIHIVGPIVQDRLTEELMQELADCYTNSLDLCLENGLRTVAFCCISTGVFRFPNRQAAHIAVKSVSDWITAHPEAMDKVIFNVFKDEDRIYYEQELF